MKPDIAKHKPDPSYLRALLDKAKLSQVAAARLLGVSERAMRSYLAPAWKSGHPVPYTVQFALECLAKYGAALP